MDAMIKSLRLELYAKTEWGEDDPDFMFDWTEPNNPVPNYTCEYLLTKLPRRLGDYGQLALTLQITNINQWCASYDNDNGGSSRDSFGQTPLEALLTLALRLIDRGEINVATPRV